MDDSVNKLKLRVNVWHCKTLTVHLKPFFFFFKITEIIMCAVVDF